MLRSGSAALCVLLFILGSVPAQAQRSDALAMKIHAEYDGPDDALFVDVRLANNLGESAKIFGELRILVNRQELEREAFALGADAAFAFVFRTDDLPRPLPESLSVCAIADYTVQITDRRGRVRELDDVAIRCQEVSIRGSRL